MASYKEIVTKAVIGKGKKFFRDNYSVEVETTPTTVLGCWVINHKFKGFKSGDKIGVDGSYDVNIWYSYDNDSKTMVVNKKIEYNDIFNVKIVVYNFQYYGLGRTPSRWNCPHMICFLRVIKNIRKMDLKIKITI